MILKRKLENDPSPGERGGGGEFNMFSFCPLFIEIIYEIQVLALEKSDIHKKLENDNQSVSYCMCCTGCFHHAPAVAHTGPLVKTAQGSPKGGRVVCVGVCGGVCVFTA